MSEHIKITADSDTGQVADELVQAMNAAYDDTKYGSRVYGCSVGIDGAHAKIRMTLPPVDFDQGHENFLLGEIEVPIGTEQSVADITERFRGDLEQLWQRELA